MKKPDVVVLGDRVLLVLEQKKAISLHIPKDVDGTALFDVVVARVGPEAKKIVSCGDKVLVPHLHPATHGVVCDLGDGQVDCMLVPVSMIAGIQK